MCSFESFGLNMIEGWYFGCSVFDTDYDSFKDLIVLEVGVTANNAQDLSGLKVVYLWIKNPCFLIYIGVNKNRLFSSKN